MKFLSLVIVVIGVVLLVTKLMANSSASKAKIPASLYGIQILGNDNKLLDLKAYKGRPILFVNVASRCGFTSQYDDLERLYQEYKGKGLVIIAVPSNDFGEQEPGTNAEIASFCKLNYGVTFPLTTKVSVKGEQQHLLYRYLTASNPKVAGSIKWNFTKILVGKDGRVLNRFSSATKPMSKKIINAVEAAL